MIKWICSIMLVCITAKSKHTPTVDNIVIDQCEAPTKELVLSELRSLGVQHPKIVLAQSVLETGHYKSKVMKTHNNLFGFRTKKGYIKFKNWKLSVAYYKWWQERHYKQNKYNNYYAFLRSIGYAEDPTYTTKVKKIANELSKSKTQSTLSANNSKARRSVR